MRTEPSGFEVGGTRFGVGDVGFHIAANPSPDIEFIGQINGNLIVGLRSRGGALLPRRTRARAADLGTSGDLREEVRAGDADRRAGSPKPRLGDGDVLVRDV